jgi:curli biogenesis system outer membrane secretion channel CsgG
MKILLTKFIGIFLLFGLFTGCAPKQQMEFVKKDFYQQKELNCISYKVSKNIILGVGAIPDLTGKTEYGTLGSHFISKAGSQMMVTALIEGGARLVNRHDLVIVNFEKDAAMKHWLGKDEKYRPIKVGSLKGSDYYITGSISTLDFNTDSKGLELYINGIGGGSRYQEIIVGGDFIVTDTITSEIIYAKAVHFKLYSKEVKAGVFHLFNEDLVNLNVGYTGNDPLQMATRYMIDKAAADILRKINNIEDSECDIFYKKEDKKEDKKDGEGNKEEEPGGIISNKGDESDIDYIKLSSPENSNL